MNQPSGGDSLHALLQRILEALHTLGERREAELAALRDLQAGFEELNRRLGPPPQVRSRGQEADSRETEPPVASAPPPQAADWVDDLVRSTLAQAFGLESREERVGRATDGGKDTDADEGEDADTDPDPVAGVSRSTAEAAPSPQGNQVDEALLVLEDGQICVAFPWSRVAHVELAGETASEGTAFSLHHLLGGMELKVEPYRIRWAAEDGPASLTCAAIGGVIDFAEAGPRGVQAVIVPSPKNAQLPPSLQPLVDFMASIAVDSRIRRPDDVPAAGAESVPPAATAAGEAATAPPAPGEMPGDDLAGEARTGDAEEGGPSADGEGASCTSPDEVLADRTSTGDARSGGAASSSAPDDTLAGGTKSDDAAVDGRVAGGGASGDAAVGGAREPRGPVLRSSRLRGGVTPGHAGTISAHWLQARGVEPAGSARVNQPAPEARTSPPGSGDEGLLVPSALLAVRYLPARVLVHRLLRSRGWLVVEALDPGDIESKLARGRYEAIFADVPEEHTNRILPALHRAHSEGSLIVEVCLRLRRAGFRSLKLLGEVPQLFYPFHDVEMDRILKLIPQVWRPL